MGRGTSTESCDIPECEVRKKCTTRAFSTDTHTSVCVVALGKEIAKFVESAAKEAPPRRARLRMLLSFSADFYRQLMHALAGAPIVGDPPLRRAVQTAVAKWPGTDESAAECLETCLTMESYVDANANLNTLAECWLDELAEKAGVGRGA